MNELKIFENPAFGKVRVAEQGGEPWFVAKDVCDTFGATNRNRIMQELDDDEKGYTQIDTPGGKQNISVVNESGLYQMLFALQPTKARGVTEEHIQQRVAQLREFKRWVTHEVLPAIRKTGGYIAGSEKMSDAELMAKAVLVAQATIKERDARIAELETENTVQRQAIADFKPTQEYVDKILASKDVVTTTQIAADYGMSTVQLNMFLSEQRVQRVVGGQWILYKNHMGKGYTKSETIRIKHRDGSEGIKMQTKWTQKGRLFIHNLLTNKGYKANMDKEGA